MHISVHEKKMLTHKQTRTETKNQIHEDKHPKNTIMKTDMKTKKITLKQIKHLTLTHKNIKS